MVESCSLPVVPAGRGLSQTEDRTELAAAVISTPTAEKRQTAAGGMVLAGA